jgi:holliday junction DNA helicase RuvB
MSTVWENTEAPGPEESERLVSAEHTEDDLEIDRSLRPRRLDEYLGQQRVKENLGVLIDAARGRDEPLDHILLSGPPGLGKTTLASVIAAELDVRIRTTSGPAIERAGDLAAILTNLEERDVLFIDEIHRLNRAVEEILYPAMEDFALDIVIGKGPSARNIRLKLPRFTLIGATTRLALMTAPLRARFGAVYRFDFYELDAMEAIVSRAARLLQAPITPDGVAEVARRGRGTPRVALRLLRRVRDYAQVRSDGVINQQMAHEALALLEIDELGLDALDRQVIGRIIRDFRGGPVGLETIAAALSEEPDTIMDVVEPYLLQLGFLERTPRGRVATRRAYDHLGEPYPESPEQPGLFQEGK